MIHFPDTVLHRYTLSTNSTDLYGAPRKEYTYTEDITVDFQEETNTELAHEYGVDLQNFYRAYVDINTSLNDTDQLRDDTGNKYHIIGNIQVYNQFHKYKKINLAKERKQ